MLFSRIILMILIIASGIFASFYGGNVSYAFFYFSLMIPVISFAYTFYVFVCFRLFQDIGQRIVVKGDLTPYAFTLGNENYITFRSIKVNFLHDKSIILNTDNMKEYCLLPGASETTETKLRCNYRGIYYVGASSVDITDFLYLFRITYPVQSKVSVTVLPRVVQIDRLGIVPAQKDTKNLPYYLNQPHDTMDIVTRKYQLGDSKKQIHWKATAKRNELFSRTFIANPKSETIIIMDLQELKEDELTTYIIEDQIIESALAITNYLKNNNTHVSVYYEHGGLQKAEVRSKVDFDIFYQMCVSMSFHSNVTVENILNLSRNVCMQGSFVIVLTHNLTEELYYHMVALSQQGNDLALLLMRDKIDPDKESLLVDLKLAGISFRLITREDEIREVLTS